MVLGRQWTLASTMPVLLTGPQLSDFDGDGDLDAVVGQLSLGGNSTRTEFAWFEAPSNPEQNWIRHTLATDINGKFECFRRRH